MWILLAFLSALLLGFYDVSKKVSLRNNAVLPVLMINTVTCALFFAPVLIGSRLGFIDLIPLCDIDVHLLVLAKAIIVLTSWIFGYYAIKHLPLTIVGPINATRPIITLLGALIIYGESLNPWQWCGVLLAIISILLLSTSGRKEGIRFEHNLWIVLLFLAAILGTASGLYDKYLLAPINQGGAGLNSYFVQAWYNTYQAVLMTLVMLFIWYPNRHKGSIFKWRWSILLISVFLTLADMAYFYALSRPDVLISVVSMVRRSSVLISFLFGAFLFHEKNLKSKIFDLVLIFLGMVCLYIGTA